MAAPAVGLNLSGKVFFGGLCAGTFYLGTWQTQRYFEKISLMEKRLLELKEDPVWLKDDTDTEAPLQGFRRRLIEGSYRHEDEMLVGPRGPPVGALTASGPASGRSEGGMSSGPQVRTHIRFRCCTAVALSIYSSIDEQKLTYVTACCCSPPGLLCHYTLCYIQQQTNVADKPRMDSSQLFGVQTQCCCRLLSSHRSTDHCQCSRQGRKSTLHGTAT